MTEEFLAVGNEELEMQENLLEGDLIRCNRCGSAHPVSYGNEKKSGKKSSLLIAYTCGSKVFLAGIAGKCLPGIERIRQ